MNTVDITKGIFWGKLLADHLDILIGLFFIGLFILIALLITVQDAIKRQFQKIRRRKGDHTMSAATAKEEYIIIPNWDFHSETITADSSDQALEIFLKQFQKEPPTCFTVIKKDEFDLAIMRRDQDAHTRVLTSFMKDTLMNDFGFDEEDAQTYATIAYERYCEGKGETEYECIQWAADQKE